MKTTGFLSEKPMFFAGIFVIGEFLKASELFELPESLSRFAPWFLADDAPWKWLKKISEALASLEGNMLQRGTLSAGIDVRGPVWIDPSVELPAYTIIIGPVYVGAGTEIRPGAFLRGNVIAGAGCVLGNACEFKNCLLLDRVQAPHFNYVGDSVLGNGAHLGAGAICSNLRLDHREIDLRLPGGNVATGLRKFGAIIGDGAEVGCNAVLNPGSVLGRRAVVMPTLAFSGYLPPAALARERAPMKLPSTDC